MNLSTAFSGTMSGDFLFACLFFFGLKLLSGLAQARLLRGNWRHTPDTRLFRLIYLTGKVTPAVACLCGFVSALLAHDRFYSWFFGCFAIFISVTAGYVVRLRRQGRFFGLADLISSARRH